MFLKLQKSCILPFEIVKNQRGKLGKFRVQLMGSLNRSRQSWQVWGRGTQWCAVLEQVSHEKKKRGPLLSIQSSWLFKVPGSLFQCFTWKNPHIKAPVYPFLALCSRCFRICSPTKRCNGWNRDCWYKKNRKTRPQVARKRSKKPNSFTPVVEVKHNKIQFPSSQVTSSLKLHPGKLTCPKKLFQ